MPCLIGCLALATPRLALVLVWLFSSLLQNNYVSTFWPLLGFVFLPLTTLAYAYAHRMSAGPPQGIWLALVVVAVIVDLGLVKSSSGRKSGSKSR